MVPFQDIDALIFLDEPIEPVPASPFGLAITHCRVDIPC